MKKFIKSWLGIKEVKAKRPFVFRVEHPDFIEQQMTPDMRRGVAGFFKESVPGRVLMANLYQDVDELMQQASSTPDADLRDYLISKAGGQRDVLAKILTLCVIQEEKPLRNDDSMEHDEVAAAMGHDFEISDGR